MRRILVDNARRKRSKKRGGDRARLDLDQFAAMSERSDNVLDIDAALVGLADADPQAAELVKLRYFAGLSIPQAAAVLGISPRTRRFPLGLRPRLAAPLPGRRRRQRVSHARFSKSLRDPRADSALKDSSLATQVPPMTEREHLHRCPAIGRPGPMPGLPGRGLRRATRAA